MREHHQKFLVTLLIFLIDPQPLRTRVAHQKGFDPSFEVDRFLPAY
jgi:pantothenate kinase